MKSAKWQAAYQAAVRALSNSVLENRSTHDIAERIATQTVGDECDAEAELLQMLRKECRAKENDLITLEYRIRVLRRRVSEWRRAARGHEALLKDTLQRHAKVVAELEDELRSLRVALADGGVREALNGSGADAEEG